MSPTASKTTLSTDTDQEHSPMQDQLQPVARTPRPDAPHSPASHAGPSHPEPAPLSLGRSVSVELRKLVNTRSQQAIMVGGLLLASVFAGGRALFSNDGTTVSDLVSMAAGPAGWMLMVLAVLLVSSEFSRRSIETSLVLDPSRTRYLASKIIAVLLAALVTMAGCLVLAVGAAVVGPLLGGDQIPMTFDARQLAVVAGSLVFVGLAALAWALATRNAPAPIMVLLLWPTISMMISSLSAQADRIISWVDVEPVWSLVEPTAGVLARFATSTLVWIVLPAAVGVYRLLKRDL